MNRIGKIALVAGVLLVAAAIAGVAQPRLGRSATASVGTTITVTGTGKVNATPDRASFDFGVQTQATTAAEVLSKNAEQARAIIDALKKAGIDASDIQTTQVSLWPQTSPDGSHITGYQASNSVQVTGALAQAGDLVDAAVGAGANNVNGPSLDTADKSSLYNAALKQALSDANGKAQAIAEASGLTLGAVEKVSESSSQPTPIPLAANAAASSAPPIEAGTQQIQASLTVTYRAA